MTPDQPDLSHPPFVLVHGSRHGGWCWRRVAVLLRSAGHDVYTPTLTGLGERSHLLTPEIGLATHVHDLVATFLFEDIQDAILVAHSYAGMVCSGAMEQIADRVRYFVLLDAHMPREGESVFDLNGPDRTAATIALAQERGAGWYIPPADAARYGVTDPADVAWVNSKMTAQPLKTYSDPVGPTDRAWDHPGMFVQCEPSIVEPAMIERARSRSRTDPRFQFRRLDAAHNAMVTNPADLVELLLETAKVFDPNEVR
ncbi:MAG: alpha/beta fold hydrolase [Nakamurella sp.]